MVKGWRKTLTALLCLAMMLTLTPRVSSAAVTRADAVAWAYAQQGRANCDIDGNGMWCTDLATAYINYCWLRANNDYSDPWVLNNPYTTRMAYAYDDYLRDNVNWTVITRTSTTVPQPGDLFVSEQDSAGYGYGHVGIILEVYGSTSADIIEMSGGVKPTVNKNVRWGSTASYNPQYFIRFNYFTVDSYTVSYNANGGSGAPGQQTKTKGQALTLSSTKPTRANSSAGSYTVTLNPNGGKVDTTSLSAARTTSYTFKNWNTASNGGGTAYASGASYTTDANVTLYAQWNSSTSTASVTLPTPWRYGYTFKGWGTSSTATSGVTGSYKPAKNLTLYAVWEKEDISGWMTSKPNGIDDEYIETATQYRYSDRTVTGGWTQTGSGTIDYVQSWPSGFNTSHSLYSQYNKTPKTAGTTGNKKIEVNSNTFLTYIYWHWTYNNAYTSGGNFNVFISDVPYETDSSGRYYQYFTAFTSATDAGHVDPNGRNGGDCFYMWRDINSDGSWWWFRIPVYRQTYTEYTGSNSSETWSDWSDWTLISYATGENRKSQTRTVYRYKSNGSTGWLNLGGKWVYLSESGTALTSWQKLGGKWYYFDNSGVMQTGWRKVNGKWYCFATGDGGYMLTGWQKLGGKWYYFNPGDDGSMVTGWKKLDGKWYYFNTGNDGSMVTGWQTLSGKRYYFSSDGSMLTGWQKLSGKWYYFKPGDDGSMVTGWQTLGGKKYYFNSDGSMATGWQKLSGKWYYFAPGDSGYMLTGWQKLNNKWYYFNTDGSMATGWQRINSKWYYFLPGDNGQMVTGWKQIDGDWYYFMPGNDGSMVANTTMTIDGKSYTFNASGVCTNP